MAERQAVGMLLCVQKADGDGDGDPKRVNFALRLQSPPGKFGSELTLMPLPPAAPGPIFALGMRRETAPADNVQASSRHSTSLWLSKYSVRYCCRLGR